MGRPGAIEKSLEDHRFIVNALKMRNPDAVSAAFANHILRIHDTSRAVDSGGDELIRTAAKAGRPGAPGSKKENAWTCTHWSSAPQASIGRKLVAALIAGGELRGRPIEKLTLADIVAPEMPKFGGKVETVAADLSDQGVAAKLVATRPDLIFHLAAIVSGEAEADFEKGYRVNMDGTRALFEAIRLEGLKAPYAPKVVFTSSIVVYRRAAARDHRRHLFPDTADELRHTEGDRRTAARRLFAARFL